MADTTVHASAPLCTHTIVTQQRHNVTATAELCADLPAVKAKDFRLGLSLTERDGDVRPLQVLTEELDTLMALPLFRRAASVHEQNMHDASAEKTVAKQKSMSRVYVGIICARMFRAGYLAALQGGAR